MSSLPWGRRAVFVVGVYVVVVHILPSQHGGTRWAAHRGGHKCIDKRRPSILHNPSGFIHHLQGPCNERHGSSPCCKKYLEYIGCSAVKSKVSVISLPLDISFFCSVAKVILGENKSFLLYHPKYFSRSNKHREFLVFCFFCWLVLFCFVGKQYITQTASLVNVPVKYVKCWDYQWMCYNSFHFVI